MDLWYPPSAWERIMKIQEVFQKAKHDRITWNEAAEILGVDPRTVRRWKHTIQEEYRTQSQRPKIPDSIPNTGLSPNTPKRAQLGDRQKL